MRLRGLMELTVSGDIKSPAPEASARNPDQPEPPDPSATSPLTLQRVGEKGARLQSPVDSWHCTAAVRALCDGGLTA
ncbi:unnamed protein product [Arctogadus glacialis]